MAARSPTRGTRNGCRSTGCSTEPEMHHFAYRDGVLHAEGVSIPALAEAVGTPFYCYSTPTIERHYRVFPEPFAGLPPLTSYPLNPTSNQAIIPTLHPPL